jgi:hypothetical protein
LVSAEPFTEGDPENFTSDLKTVLLHAQNTNGLVIRCEEIPPITAHPPCDISSDRIAFHVTADEPMCIREYPSSAAFCHVSLRHAKKGFQVAPYGTVTYIRSKVGDIAFLLGWKKGSAVGEHNFNSGEWLLDDTWDTEIILVCAGSTLYVCTFNI